MTWIRDCLNLISLKDHVSLDTIYRDPTGLRSIKDNEKIEEELQEIASGLDELVLEEDYNFLELK